MARVRGRTYVANHEPPWKDYLTMDYYDDGTVDLTVCGPRGGKKGRVRVLLCSLKRAIETLEEVDNA